MMQAKADELDWKDIGNSGLQWAIENTTLKIELKSGVTSAAMPDWANIGSVPWHNQRASITSVEIGKGVTSIGFAAFGSCSSLTSITIPDSVTSIGNAAFASCSALENITIPDSVTEIGTNEFLGCTNLSSITAPCTLKATESTWKEGCNATVTYTHPIKDGQTQCTCKKASRFGDNLYYTLDEETGKLTIGLVNPDETDKNKNAMPNWDSENNKAPWSESTAIKSVEIKDGVTNVGDYAFCDIQSMNNVKLPDSLESIGQKAFYKTNLTSIIIPANVKTIGEGAIGSCKYLKSVRFKGNFYGYNETDSTGFHPQTFVGENLNTIPLIYPDNNSTWSEVAASDGTEIEFLARKFIPYVYSLEWHELATNLRWSIDENGKFILETADKTKTGFMSTEDPYNYGDSYPWAPFRDSITSAEIREGVTRIPYNALGYCSSLTEVSIPKSAEVIAGNAFIWSDITSITIPYGVKDIYREAFSGCESLKEVEISGSVKSIGDNAFDRCPSLESIKFKAGVPEEMTSSITFKYVGTPEKPATLYYPEGYKSWLSLLGKATVVNGVYSWGTASNRSYFKPEMYVPWNNIEGTNLRWKIDDEGELTIGLIDENATTGNAMPNWGYDTNSAPWSEIRESIKSVVIDDKVTSIGDFAFNDCNSFESVTIPNSVTSIGDSAFEGCDMLESVTIPNSVKSIGDYAFDVCDMLSSVTFEEDSTLESIGDYAFNQCSSITNITIPDSVTSIGNNAFCYCLNLKSVIIGENVKSIGAAAFGQTNLTSVTIPSSVEKIGDGAFALCSRLTEVKFEGDVPAIEDVTDEIDAFTSVGGDEAVTLLYPQGKESWQKFITDNAAIIKNGILNWEGGRFKLEADVPYEKIDGTNLQWKLNDEGKLTIDTFDKNSETGNTMPQWNRSDEAPWDSDRTSINSVVIKDGVTSISQFAFMNCSNIESVKIADSVTSIDDSAFNGCTKLNKVTFDVDSKLTTIGSKAFEGCQSLKSIVLPDSVESIGLNALCDCTSITAPCAVKTNADTWKGSAEVTYTHPLKEGEETCACGEKEFKPCGEGAYYVFDEETGKLTITGTGGIIGEAVFSDCSEESEFGPFADYDKIKSVEIGKDILAIDGYAFGGCYNLESVVFAKGSQLVIINTAAFAGCESLKSIVIPDRIMDIAESAFESCSALKKIIFTGNATYIDTTAFNNDGEEDDPLCILYPNSDPTWLEYDADYFDEGNCYYKFAAYNKIDDKNLMWYLDNGKLTIDLANPAITDENKNTIPDWNNVEDLPWCDVMDSITSVEIGKGVTHIGDCAFASCKVLSDITIPDSVTSIGKEAFSDCKNLSSITIPDSVTSIGDDVFKNCEKLSSITAPCALKSSGEDWNGCDATVTYTHPIKKGETHCACGERQVKLCGDSAYYELDEETGKLTITGTGAIADYAFERNEEIKSVVIGEGITGIGNYAFVYCESLTNITIPSSLKNIGEQAFYSCTALEDVTFAEGSKLTSIGNGAFTSCTGLKAITLPDSVTSLGNGVFSMCSSLEKITAPCTLSGEDDWKGSATVTYTHPIKNGDTKCACGARELKPCGDSVYYLFDEETGKLTITGTGAIGADVFASDSEEWSEFGLFADYDKITSVEIGKDITEIGEYAFYGCSNLESVTFAKGSKLESIEAAAFLECSSLTSITIPDSVTYIGQCAFYLCSSLNTIIFKGEVPEMPDVPWYDEEDTRMHRFSGVGTPENPVKLVCYILNDTWYDFLDENAANIDDSGILNWEGGYFKPEVDLSIPYINITGTNLRCKVNSEGTLIIDRIVESATTGNAIPECRDEEGQINEANVPWSEADFIKSVEIADGVTHIGSASFYTDYFESVAISESVTGIGDIAFLGCSYLTSVTFAENSKLETIGNEAFEATGLTEIKIPDGVTSIGDGAFSDCTSLESITFEGNVPDMGDEYDVFANVGTPQNPVTLYYPKGNTTWKTFLETAKSEGQIDANGVLNWDGGYFTVESCVIWKNITDTDLRWAIDEGALCIDKQENPSSDNFDVPDFSDDAPWKNYVNQINRVVISKDVEGVDDTSFAGFEGKILVLENGYNGTMPDDINNSTYSSFGGGEFIYKTQLVGGSLSLDGQIGVNLSFYVNKDEGSTITINGETVDLSECEHEGDIYTYTLWVAPRDAYKDITFKTEKDSDTIVDQTYNVKDEYVDVVLEDEEHKTYSEDVYNMVSSLNLFINSSRIYFNEVGENEAAAIKNSITSALENLDLSGLNKAFVKDEVDEAVYYGSSLILDSGVKLRHYITIADEDNVANIKIKVGDTTYESDKLEKASFTSNSHDVYYFETDEFNPKDFGTNVSVTYNGEKKIIDNYSVLTFISLSLGNPETAAKELGTTCRSIYNYYLAADNYNKN